jgi:hypothetical protein
MFALAHTPTMVHCFTRGLKKGGNWSQPATSKLGAQVNPSSEKLIDSGTHHNEEKQINRRCETNFVSSYLSDKKQKNQ